MQTYTPEQLINAGELVLPVSEWITLDQAMISTFADVTRDHQFIHIDPERAKKETNFGGTIAHGFFTLSLLSGLAEKSFPSVEGTVELLNYGMDKLRFLAPVPTGGRIRAHFKMADCRLKDEGHLLVRYSVSVEIENQEKPAFVCEWLAMVLFESA